MAYLTEEKGEGVFAADVWPKMELEEVFPKSDCPPEPPNMLPARVEVPKPPLPWPPPSKWGPWGDGAPPNTEPEVLWEL